MLNIPTNSRHSSHVETPTSNNNRTPTRPVDPEQRAQQARGPGQASASSPQEGRAGLTSAGAFDVYQTLVDL